VVTTTAVARRPKVSTERIRIELTFGALTMKELARRMGVSNTQYVWPVVWQMQHRTHEVVAIPGKPNRYALKRQHTALEGWR
jgi:hypothetical protein